MVAMSVTAKECAVREEGLAMAFQLAAMLQGKVQMRLMRHQVAEWAMLLAPQHARPLLLKGEALLDQPLSGHDESESEEVLRRALALHRRRLLAAGLTPEVTPEGIKLADIDEPEPADNGVGGAERADPDELRADPQYWAVLARALHEIGGGARDREAIEVLREGRAWLPAELELVLQMGSMLEQVDPAAAVELYASFPQPADGQAPDFNHACVASSAVRLIIEQRDWEHPHLLDALVTVGRVLGGAPGPNTGDARPMLHAFLLPRASHAW